VAHGKWLQYSSSSILPLSSQQVPEILGFWRKMKRNSTSVQAIFLSVLDVLAGRFPRDVLTSVLTQLPHTDQRYQPRIFVP